MASWQAMKVPELRAELKHRDLPHKGVKATLTARLKHTDGLPLNYEDRKTHYELKLKEFQAEPIANVAPFPYFNKFPLEIQRLIWEFSLPAPRVIRYPNGGVICEHRLYLPKDHQPPNPAALSTCRESRAAALKRYKLCFGTTNVYADLPGGDILHLNDPFIAWEWDQYTQRGRRRSLPVHKILCADVAKDLEAVKHIILPTSYWRRPSAPIGVAVQDGRDTRNRLRRLKSLKRVSLAADPDIDHVFAGYSHVPDPFFEKPQRSLGPDTCSTESSDFLKQYDDDPHRETFAEWRERRKRILGDKDAIRFIGGYELCHLQKTDIEQGIPEIRVVKLKNIPYLPRRVEENNRGYPYEWCCDRKTPEEEANAPRTNARDGLRKSVGVQR